MIGDDHYDLCIIGAGMYGSAAARHASANPTLKVCLLGPTEPKETEMKNREIFGCHYDEGRIVHCAYRNYAMQVLAKHTIDRFRELEKLSGIKLYHPVGCLVTVERNSDFFYTLLQGCDSSKVPYVNLSSGDIFQKRFPYMKLEDSDYPFFEDYGAGHVSARKVVDAQKKVAMLQGCDIIEEVVDDVSDLINGLHVITTEIGRILKCKRVLLCTGAFTNFMKQSPVSRLKISVHKETAAMLRISKEEQDRLKSMPTIMLHRNGTGDVSSHPCGAYILPPILYPDGHYYLKIGHMGDQKNSSISTLKEIKEWYNDDQGDPEVINKYSNILFKIIPDLKVEKISSKTCVTCSSPSDLPYIDRITPTVTVAVVGNGRGATMCDEVGRLAAHLSLTGNWDSTLSKSLFETIPEEK